MAALAPPVPLLEPDLTSLVSSPGVGVRTPPYIPAYNHPEYSTSPLHPPLAPPPPAAHPT